MNIKKILFAISTFVLALTLSACSAPSKIESNITTGLIKPLDNLTYNWEDINIKGGNVKKGFHFTNDSDQNLILKGASTSCMCTTAYIELPDGTLSPEFGMHGNPNWSYEVKPGEEFEVEVEFDPMAHGPNGVGPIARSVYLFTSSETNGDYTQTDSSMPNIAITEIRIQGDVLYEKEYKEKYADLDFIFQESEFDFGIVQQSQGLVSHDFNFKYVGEDEIEVTATPASCACTSSKISKNYFKPGDKGILTVTFDPNLHQEPEGRFFKTASILTSPKLKKQPEVKIWAEIDLDLGPEAYKLKEHKD